MKLKLLVLLVLLIPAIAFGQNYQTIYNATGVTASSSGTTEIDLEDNPVAGDYAIEVTNTAGTDPTLDVTIQMSRDGSVWWTLGTYPQFTTTGKASLHITQTTTQVLSKLRLLYTIGGTDTPTWNIKSWVVYTPAAN